MLSFPHRIDGGGLTQSWQRRVLFGVAVGSLAASSPDKESAAGVRGWEHVSMLLPTWGQGGGQVPVPQGA